MRSHESAPDTTRSPEDAAPGDRVEALRRMAIFGGVEEAVVRSLVERSSERTVEPGGLFFCQGEKGDSAFVLEEGSVEIIRSHAGREHRLRTLGAGDCFGEVALLDFGERSASVRALSRCRAIELTARDLHAVAVSSPEQFALIYMNLGRELSRRLREADDRFFKALWVAEPLRGDWDFGVG